MDRFEREWRERGAIAHGMKRTRGPLDWLAYQLARFRAWRLARTQAKCSHEVLGQRCVKCGWPLRLLNVYVPTGYELAPSFARWARRELPPGVKIVVVDDCEGAHLGTVGFELPALDFALMTGNLGAHLVEAKP